ncbi:MAG TPA: LptF/LptG family permease [Alphaproteobacteria bacterium]|nr:LptF/LptG family permease [Alphaproteobacteria bacterium]
MNPSLVGRYLFRNLAITTLVATLIASLVMWLIQALKFFELAVNGGAPLTVFLTLVALQMPGLIAVILPIILALVIAFVYNKLTAESELIVLRALGLSQWRLAMPALVLGGIVAVTVFFLNAFVAPVANEQLKTLLDMSRTQYNGVPLNAGAFNAVNDKLTIYVSKHEPNGDLEGILIYQDEDNGKRVAIVAKRGVLAEGDHGPEIVVYDGKRQEVDPKTGNAPFNEFKTAAIDLEQVQDELTKRWKEPSERTLPELLRGPLDDRDAGHGAAFLGEAHTRIASPFFALALTGVALVTLLGGRFDRRGQFRRLLIGFLIMLFLEMASIGLSNLARNHGIAIPLLYLLAIVASASAFIIFARANDGSPPWRIWLSGFTGARMRLEEAT